jgi:hypothetical protein
MELVTELGMKTVSHQIKIELIKKLNYTNIMEQNPLRKLVVALSW